MKFTNLHKNIWLVVAVVAFSIDQIVKIVLVEGLWSGFVVNDWLQIKLVFNHGIAFGFGDGYGIIISSVAFILFAYLMYANRDWLYKTVAVQVGVGLLLAGAISNLLDRLRFDGGVVDYIDVSFYSIFNIADIIIFVGVVLLVIEYWRGNSDD